DARGATAQTARERLEFDHTELSDFGCFYVHEFDLRDRFFRGEFGKDIWVALRDRYIEFERSEVENLAFQMSLELCVEDASPVVNSPRALLACRLRLPALARLSRQGLPVAAYRLAWASGAGTLAKRLRIGEDYYYDVPSFPYDLSDIISLTCELPREIWRVAAVKSSHRSRMMIVENGLSKAALLPEAAAELAERASAVLDLDVAEVHLAPYPGGIRVLDVLPSPRISEFEEVTGERCSSRIAERLISLGESK
ncbi:MAG TPA: hypothetical protein VMU02_01015, partial [bacterium]|nr:hypothetical protein [bacterium]